MIPPLRGRIIGKSKARAEVIVDRVNLDRVSFEKTKKSEYFEIRMK